VDREPGQPVGARPVAGRPVGCGCRRARRHSHKKWAVYFLTLSRRKVEKARLHSELSQVHALKPIIDLI